MSGALTIPRLELVAAALATRIVCSMLQTSNVKYERVIYWSNSLATLHLYIITLIGFAYLLIHV